MQPIDLTTTVLHLRGEAEVAQAALTPDFWQAMPARSELHGGRIVVSCRFEADWTSWEVHPDGEELVVLLTGQMDLLLEGEGVDERVELRAPGQTAIVPRGVWHTADVPESAQALFVTPGAWKTQDRPR